jgi:diguanylate cyclase (GGDEF)-like protein
MRPGNRWGSTWIDGVLGMRYEIVHTIGSTIYFVFFILFLWMSRIPRTNPGALCWAAAMVFALVSRLAFVTMLAHGDKQVAVPLYYALNMIEKLFLVIGLVRFFAIPVRLSWFYAATVAVEIWIFIAWATAAPPLLRGFGVSVFSAGFLAYAGWIAYQNRKSFHPRLMSATTIISAILVVHWLTAFAIVEVVPDWLTPGFLFGTILVLAQYLTLLAALLLSFQQRLLSAEAKALDMAFLDPLTGLNNQRYVDTLFDKALVLATRPHQLVAILYIDLDNFKPVNDRAGHAVGDQVLKIVAGRLRAATRSTDICARIGGDEFVAVCTQLEDQSQVDVIATKLLDKFTSPITVDGKDYLLGASIGISLYPMHADSLPKLMKCADSAMYEIKRSGKNGYRIYASEAAAGAMEVSLS